MTPSASATVATGTLRIADVLHELDRRCAPKQPASTNVEMKGQMGAQAECLRVAVNGELDRSLVPWKTAAPERFAATMTEQATFNRYADAACELAEDTFWIDLDLGTRDDGSHRSVPMMGCRIGLLQERFFFARALFFDDAMDLAAHVTELRAAGERATAELGTLHTQAAALVAAPPDAAASPRSLDAAGRAALLARIETVQKGVFALAKSACHDWPALAAQLGGDDACVDAAALYFAAHASYGRGP